MANKKTNYKHKPEVQFLDLFYMSPSELYAKDIASVFQSNSELVVELWTSMNVLEVILPNQISIDFEPVETSFKDPSDASFVKNRNIKTIFAVQVSENDLPAVIPYFEQLINQHSGFLCSDSSDFTPVYAGSTKK